MWLFTQIYRPFLKWKGRRKAERLSRSNKPVKLDLGCGMSARPGFTGIDLFHKADICWDLRWGLPFAAHSVAEIRSDHFLEHLNLSMVVAVLRECYRVLEPGGRLDFTVPHLDPYLDAYLRHDLDFLTQKITDIPTDQPELYTTCFDKISWLLYRDGEHKSLFDRDAILAKVRLAGFSQVNTRTFDPDRDVNYRFSSVYVVARK